MIKVDYERMCVLLERQNKLNEMLVNEVVKKRAEIEQLKLDLENNRDLRIEAEEAVCLLQNKNVELVNLLNEKQAIIDLLLEKK